MNRLHLPLLVRLCMGKLQWDGVEQFILCLALFARRERRDSEAVAQRSSPILEGLGVVNTSGVQLHELASRPIQRCQSTAIKKKRKEGETPGINKLKLFPQVDRSKRSSNEARTDTLAVLLLYALPTSISQNSARAENEPEKEEDEVALENVR